MAVPFAPLAPLMPVSMSVTPQACIFPKANAADKLNVANCLHNGSDLRIELHRAMKRIMVDLPHAKVAWHHPGELTETDSNSTLPEGLRWHGALSTESRTAARSVLAVVTGAITGTIRGSISPSSGKASYLLQHGKTTICFLMRRWTGRPERTVVASSPPQYRRWPTSQTHYRNTNQEHNQRRLGHRLGGSVAGFELTQQRLQNGIGEIAVAGFAVCSRSSSGSFRFEELI